MLWTIALALVAAFLFAAAASLQQHAAHQTAYGGRTDGTTDRVTDQPTNGLSGGLPGGLSGGTPTRTTLRRPSLRPLFRLLRALLRNPIWLAGWITNLFGFGAQAVALYLGSVALVQPVLVTQMLFALPLASAWARRWPTGRDWLSGSAITAGLVVFLVSRGVPAGGGGTADRQRVIMAVLAAAALIGVLLSAAVGRPDLVHATLYGVAAGLCFAVSATLMKLTADDLVHRGVAGTAADWVGYGLAVSTLAGLLLEQGAFAAGTLPGAVAAMTVTNPLASYLIGMLAFHVAAPAGASAWAAVLGAGAMIFAGVFGLAHSPSGRIDPQPPPHDTRR